MKRNFTFLCLLIASLPCVADNYYEATQSVQSTTEYFLQIAKQKVSGSGYNYFLCRAVDNSVTATLPSPNSRKFFIDPSPDKGWEHEAYVVDVWDGIFSGVSVDTVMIPPKYTLIPLEVSLPDYGDYSNPQFCVNSVNSDEKVRNVCNTYALIISGGIDPYCNKERYWNDCSFIYQTLTKTYNIPKDQVIPIMSDGDSPEPDMLAYPSVFVSSPLDLDFDGEDELQLSATKSNIVSSLDELMNKMNWGDQLFIFVIDHGGTVDGEDKSYICLWDDQRLYDDELASYLKPFVEKGVIVNAVLGQCHAGGFINDLNEAGCVVAAACSGPESSYACGDKPYDEFVYLWTSALNGIDAYGNTVNADFNTNGSISMKEGFEYAKKYDRRREHPEYSSFPLHLGNEMTFLSCPKPVELYIRDYINDSGEERNIDTVFWNSPDIWIRNEDDQVEEHENPYYASDHLSAASYIRVHNRGWQDYTENKYWVHGYWAQAAAGLTYPTWLGMETYMNIYGTGDFYGRAPIPHIPAGDSKVLSINWAYPSSSVDMELPEDEKHHFCLLEKIYDAPYDDEWRPGMPEWVDVTGNRAIAQKNLTIVERNACYNNLKSRVYIRNIYNDATRYSIEIVPTSERDKTLFKMA